MHSCSHLKNNVEDVSLLLKAFKFAAYKHRDQRRKDERASPYINHPIAVAETLWEIGGIRNVTTLVAGILHDVIEDTDTSQEELEQEFGVEVCNIVKELTDDKELPKTARKRLQLENIADLSWPARYVRIADKISNVEDIIHSPPARWSLERREEYVIWAGKIVDGLRGANKALEQHFDQVFSQATQKLKKERGQSLTD
jgi:GTP diphosphokinase / guanosine-3',5'-bis(diphosphate) 3'-diphosphatase